MGLARVHRVNKARKDQGKCGKCGVPLLKGDPYLHFTVGYRGVTQRRCDKARCYPPPSVRESSMVASVYDAQENADVSLAWSAEDLYQIRDDVANAATEIAEEYENNEMYDRNPDLQERAEMLNFAASDLEDWEPEDEEPIENEPKTWELSTGAYETFEDAYAEWLNNARESLQAAIDEMDLP